MVEVRNLSLYSRDRKLLDDISFTLDGGKIYALLGENGSGKTTLIRTLSSYYPDYSGSIMFDGMELREARRKARSSFHAVLPQNLPVLTMRVSEFLSMYSPGISYLSGFGLSSLAEERMNTLSGGERQMVFLSFTLSKDAMLYSFDEPEASLDATYREKTESVLRDLRNKGKSVLVSFHDISRAVGVADCILVLSHGKLVYSGTVSDFIEARIAESIFGLRRGTFIDDDGTMHTAFF